jgi:hypothetical protein
VRQYRARMNPIFLHNFFLLVLNNISYLERYPPDLGLMVFDFVWHDTVPHLPHNW